MRLKRTERAVYGQWGRWFAWHPVVIDNAIVWLETVERCRNDGTYWRDTWEYRNASGHANTASEK